MQRRKPDPIPAIHPLPEYLATGPVRDSYEDTKAVLGVPWMGVVTMAFAHYPAFWDVLWSGLRPLCASEEFGAARQRLRERSEAHVTILSTPPLTAELQARGYAPREIESIAAAQEIFAEGNMAYLLIATLARLLLEGESLSETSEVNCITPRGRPSPAPLVLMEPHHAEPETRALYTDMQTVLGLPFVNTDYRALARWPTYLHVAWAGLRPRIADASYATVTQAIHDEAVALARALPNPAGLTPEMLREAAERDAAPGEVARVVQLFQWLLPGLVANIAVFQAQLARG
ncbi:hypothetical protein DDZ14_11495 [Maritimibacter sp. 55A14]|uniref:halocarboxylic acid dehydrogenase DehI family protein n=1 Tax=Maritimibacter sp. 55A14 TaxID=2174844 RepID=UPI000D605DE4|nr:halocarboxylic acid dehydrogenase DehI family protein [Maritimibacter sp. 55A14]PWE32341.1 hypothetical protein DDZ14_11495 [Maritimibacter sp. 55A14]